jgi:hypothetical protein
MIALAVGVVVYLALRYPLPALLLILLILSGSR